MKINTNTKNKEGLILPNEWGDKPVNTKIYYGYFTCFRCGLVGYYKGGGTKNLNSSSDAASNMFVFQNDGKIYKNGSLDNGEYEYVLITAFGTNGSLTLLGGGYE